MKELWEQLLQMQMKIYKPMVQVLILIEEIVSMNPKFRLKDWGLLK